PVGATKDTYQSVARYVKENPVPSLLVGAGVAWMIIEATTTEDDDRAYSSGRRVDSPYKGNTLPPYPIGYSEKEVQLGSDRGLAQTAKEKLGEAKESVSEAAGAVKEKVAAAGEAASHAAEDLGRRAQNVYQQSSSAALTVSRNIQSGYRSGAQQLENAMDEYPLAVGMGFAALGALVGVLLPRTRREDELLGEQADQLVKVTKEKGEELLQRGKAVAERVSGSVLEEARQQGLTPEAVGEKMSEFAGKVGEVVQKAKEEAGTAAKDEKLTVENLKEEASGTEGGKQDQKSGVSKEFTGQG
ncbi:MAG TPA: hypothetical protein VIT23_16295, partial [Terrimicrobiaceae bacterium]